jgi:acetolactate synthase-1/2/3 large subunit
MAQMVGAANLAAGLRDAALSSSPMIAITGGAFAHSRDRYQYQEMDDKPAFSPYVKSDTRVESLERVAPTLRQAFRVATTGRPGAAHVEFANHHGDALELLEGDLDVGAEPRFGQIPPYRSAPDEKDVAEAARLLRSAERPVIVAGGGVRASGARAELVVLAEELSIPVAASLTGKDVIPASHPLSAGVVGLYSRQAANDVVSRADLVFFVGTKTGSLVTLGWKIPAEGTTVIQLDIAGDVTGLNYPNGASLVGDALVGLQALRAAATEIQADATATRSAWIEEITSIREDWYRKAQPHRTSDAIPIRPERLCADLSEVLPDNAVLVVDTGHSGVWSASHIDLDSAEQICIRAAGSLGWAFPASIGAQCAEPDRPVVCFTGDGGLWYHLSELETAARWNIPVTIVVNNNNAFNQEIPLWTAAYGGKLTGKHGEMWQFRPTNFSDVARDLGVESIRVEDPADLREAIRAGIAHDGPYLVDVATDMWVTAPKPNSPT